MSLVVLRCSEYAVNAEPLEEAVQDAVTIIQASSDEGMYQLFSVRLSQKITNLSNVSDV